MVTSLEHRQRIARLTSLADVTRRIAECVGPVAPRDVAASKGATLAHDITVAGRRPATALALIDGWAVHAELTVCAEAYAPALLTAPREIAAGEALGADGDAVAPLDAVTWRGGKGELPMAVSPGDGVLLPGTDVSDGEVLWRAGHCLRATDAAVLQTLGITDVCVRRPRIRIVCAGEGCDAIVCWLTAAIAADGGEPAPVSSDADIEAQFAADGADAIVVVGGTGAGPRDGSVHALQRAGTGAAHGIAISPGETAAFGMAGFRPALLIPGRLDAAVAVWLLIGRPLMTRLSGRMGNERHWPSTMASKVASTVGLTELVLVRRAGEGVAPLASKYLPLAMLAHADGYIVIPAASEGMAAGAQVTVRPLP